MEYTRDQFPNGLDNVLLEQEIFGVTKKSARVTDTDPVIITVSSNRSLIDTIVSNHNPPQVSTAVNFSQIDALKYRENTNNLGVLYPPVISAGMNSVLTQWRPNREELLKTVRRHKDPWYYVQFPISQFTGGLVLERLTADLKGLTSFVRAEIDGTDCVIYTNVLVQDDSIETIVNNYDNTQPVEVVNLYSYTYEVNVSDYNFNQLSEEIEQVLPSHVSVDTKQDGYDIMLRCNFSEEIDTSTLDPIVQNHVPQPEPVQVELEYSQGDTLLQAPQLGIKLYGSQPNEIVIDKTGQGDYTTIKGAIDYYNSLGTTAGAVFILRPGTYYEQNPLIIPARCNLASKGIPGNSRVVAMDPNSDLFILGKWTELYNINMIGPQNARAVVCDCSVPTGSFVSVQECVLYDCKIGIDCYSDNTLQRDTMLLERVQIFAASQNCETAILVRNGGYIVAEAMVISGNPGLTTWTNGVITQDPFSGTTLVTVTIQFCVNATITNSAYFQAITTSIQYNGVGIMVGPNSGSELFITTCRMENNQVYDFIVTNPNSNIKIVSAFMSDEKISFPQGFKPQINYYDVDDEIMYQRMLGNISIGSEFSPTALYVGEGQSHRLGVTIKKWNGTAFVPFDKDQSPNVSVGNQLYVGYNKTYSSLHVESNTTFTIEVYRTDKWVVTHYEPVSTCIQFHPTEATEVDNQILHWTRITVLSGDTVSSVRVGTNYAKITTAGQLYLFGSAQVTKNCMPMGEWVGLGTTIVSNQLVNSIDITGGSLTWCGVLPNDRRLCSDLTIRVNHTGTTIDISWGEITDYTTPVDTQTVTDSYTFHCMSESIWIRIVGNATINSISCEYIANKLGK
jgi:hypothetical protein